MKPLHHRRLASLTATMFALCVAPQAALLAGEAGASAASVLDSYVAGRSGSTSVQEAERHHDLGMQAAGESRLPDALRELEQAVALDPANEGFKRDLEAVRGRLGAGGNAGGQALDRLADEVQVRDQELWNEAQTKKEAGIKAMQQGDYNLADRSFQMALVRIEGISFRDERRTASTRELETLVAEARTRRETRDTQDAASRNQVAQERQRELRDIGMRLERDRLDAMLRRALRARERRDYDEAILLCEQVLKINRADERGAELLARCRRERHVYIRQMTADRWDEEHQLMSESIRSSMLPQLEIVRYTTEWPELDARRSAPTQGLEETAEAWRKEIANQLEQEITLDFQDTDLADVVAFLQKVTNANIILDTRAAAAAPPPVTLKVERMKLRFVLDFVMKITGLKYILRDEAILISNAEGTRGDLFMKIYDIRDLTHPMTSFPGPNLTIPAPGEQGSTLLPAIESTAAPEGADQFIEIIRQVVSSSTWDTGGAAITEYNGSMVVTQSAEVHGQVDELLRALRNQRGSQIHVKCKFLTVENSALEEIGVSWVDQARTSASGFPPNHTTTRPDPGIFPIGTAGNGAGATWGGTDSTGNNKPGYLYTAARINNGALMDYNSAYLGNTGGLSFSAMNWQGGSDFFARAVLNAVEKEKRGNVIFEPDLTLFNGQQAHVVNMHQQSYISDYDIVQNSFDPIISQLNYGTVLDVQAIASADKKYITLTMRPTNAEVEVWRRFGPPVTDWAGGPVISGGDDIGSGSDDTLVTGNRTNYPMMVPQIRYSAVRTTVTVPDGGSMVLAGMTNGNSQRSHAGVPFLSHIPFLGRLFSSNGRTEIEKRQMIVVQADLVLFDEIEAKL